MKINKCPCQEIRKNRINQWKLEEGIMKTNYIDWVTNPKAGSRILMEIETAVKNQLWAPCPRSKNRSRRTRSWQFGRQVLSPPRTGETGCSLTHFMGLNWPCYQDHTGIVWGGPVTCLTWECTYTSLVKMWTDQTYRGVKTEKTCHHKVFTP